MPDNNSIPTDRHSPATFEPQTRVFDEVSRIEGKVLGTEFHRVYGTPDATPGAKGLTSLFVLPPVAHVETVAVLLVDGRAVARNPGQLHLLALPLAPGLTTLTRPATEGNV